MERKGRETGDGIATVLQGPITDVRAAGSRSG